MEFEIEKLIPHRGAMKLLDAVESFDPAAGRLTARVTIREDSPFGGADGAPNWLALELMAQAAAALAGSFDRAENPAAAPRPGLLLGTRRMELKTPRLELGKTYLVSAVSECCEDDVASFACSVADESGAEAASATLSAYRPPELAAPAIGN